jgi:hypothetical protein
MPKVQYQQNVSRCHLSELQGPFDCAARRESKAPSPEFRDCDATAAEAPEVLLA